MKMCNCASCQQIYAARQRQYDDQQYDQMLSRGARLKIQLQSEAEVTPPDAEVVHGGCGKLGCGARGWMRVTNRVPFGEQNLVESWEAWCPLHGEYGQSGSSPIMWVRDEEQLTDEQKARYCGFESVSDYRKVVES